MHITIRISIHIPKLIHMYTYSYTYTYTVSILICICIGMYVCKCRNAGLSSIWNDDRQVQYLYVYVRSEIKNKRDFRRSGAQLHRRGCVIK
jgi:hypothetical protein